MVVAFLLALTVVGYFGCLIDVTYNTAPASNSTPIRWVDQHLLSFTDDSIATLSGIMIPQLAALLAICLTVFVFLFAELNSRVQDHPSERIICSGLQKDFALRVERLSIESMLLITLDYLSYYIYNIMILNIHFGHFAYTMLVLESFWASACMIWYCIDVVQYQRHLKWRAWDLTEGRYEILTEKYAAAYSSASAFPINVSSFEIEYAYTSKLVCTIAGEPEDQAVMDEDIIDRFAKAARQEVASSNVHMTTYALAEALRALYRYHSILGVLEVYKKLDFNYRGKESQYDYSIPPVATSLRLLNSAFTKWNDCFRRRPKMDDAQIPGMRGYDSEQPAAQIARGLWYRIVTGDGHASAMGSHRFPNMDFSELDLSHGQLQAVRMKFCRFVESRFDGADLSGARFEDCDLRKASFAGVNCTNLTFANSNLTGLTITDSLPVHPGSASSAFTPIAGCKMSTLSFDGCSLENARIYASNPSSPLDLSEAIFSETDFQSAEIRNAILDRCTFRNAWFSEAMLENCTGNSLDLSEAKFFGSTEHLSIHTCTFERSNGSGCLFSNAWLEKADFPYLNATNAIFENSVINDSSFESATLSRASILFTRLVKVTFMDTDVSHTTVLDSRLEECDFDGTAGDSLKLLNGVANNTTLQHVHLAKPDFSRTCFSGCCIKQSSLRRALFHRTHLVGSQISEVLLPNADCTDAVFRATRLQRSVFTRSLFDRVNMRVVQACNSDFSYAMFRHATLHDCEFRSCSWKEACFDNATLTRCMFETSSKKDHEMLCELLRQSEFLADVWVDRVRIDTPSMTDDTQPTTSKDDTT